MALLFFIPFHPSWLIFPSQALPLINLLAPLISSLNITHGGPRLTQVIQRIDWENVIKWEFGIVLLTTWGMSRIPSWLTDGTWTVPCTTWYSGSRLLKISYLVSWKNILVKGNAVASTILQTCEIYGGGGWRGRMMATNNQTILELLDKTIFDSGIQRPKVSSWPPG